MRPFHGLKIYSAPSDHIGYYFVYRIAIAVMVPPGKYFKTKVKWWSWITKINDKNVYNLQLLMRICLTTMHIYEIYFFNKVWARRPLKNYWYHGYNVSDNKGMLAKGCISKVKLNRGPFNLQSWTPQTVAWRCSTVYIYVYIQNYAWSNTLHRCNKIWRVYVIGTVFTPV